MKRFLLFPFAFFLSSCEAIKGIFKTGFWSGAILVIVVIALIIFAIAKLASRK